MGGNNKFQPLRHVSQIKQVHAVASKRWVTKDDIEALCGIGAGRASTILHYLADKGALKLEKKNKERLFGPLMDGG